MPDPVYAELKWDAVRRQLVVELTQDPIPPDEATQAMQQVDAVFAMQTRIARTGVTEYVSVAHPPADEDEEDPTARFFCATCSHSAGMHSGAPVAGMDGTHCRTVDCRCGRFVEL